MDYTDRELAYIRRARNIRSSQCEKAHREMVRSQPTFTLKNITLNLLQGQYTEKAVQN